mmetsp:Transcript_20452/g.30975  ORF Transcript_20452/g.30975 Transcript_20452/m.30975 type:complete len:256 (-) Transcript_20452:296-1063(-)
MTLQIACLENWEYLDRNLHSRSAKYLNLPQVSQSLITSLEIRRLVFVIIDGQIHKIRLGKLPHQSLNLCIAILQTSLLLSGNQILPRMVALLDDFKRIMLVHEFLIQSKDIRWLAIWNFVRAEPFSDGGQSSREELLYVINVIEEGCPFVLGIDGDNFPVGFAFIDHAEDTKNFGGTDFAGSDNSRSDFANINGIIVTSASLRIGMDKRRILPSTRKTAIVEENVTLLEFTQNTFLFILLDEITHFISSNFVLFP